MRLWNRHRRGFTFIEVLIALFVFALMAAAVSQTFINILRALERKEVNTNRNDALRFVRSQIVLEPDLETFEDGGEIETLDAGQAEWDVVVEPTDIPHLFEVFLKIEFSGTDEVESWIHEETLRLLRPTWTEDSDADDLMFDLQERIEDDRRGRDWQ